MSKSNFNISIFVGLIALCFLLYGFTNKNFIWDISVVYFILLLIIGEFIALTTTINIQNIIYIRSEEEALKSALPKIPFEVKKALKYIPINIVILVATVSISNISFLDDPLKSYWYIILFLPLIVHLLSLIPYFLLSDAAFIESKKKRLEADDRHATIVKIGKKLANKESKSCRKTNTYQYQTILHYLDNGQNPDEVFESRYTLLLPSSCCGDEKLVRSLIEYGSNVNFRSSLGMTALILACKHGFYEIASLLIENGADVNIKDLDGNTALFYAQKNEYKDIIEILKPTV
jgi:hypothetical protein